MSGSLKNNNATFGTLPVFLTAISTILGAVLFLRFGAAVGWLGFVGVLGVVVLGHLITIPTALAVAEIATNQKVQGGGAYYIISRSFGLNIGGAIGLALFFSQAISISFYVIAFSEALSPLIQYAYDMGWVKIPDYRFIRIPAMAILAALMLTKGANIGMRALYVVAGILFISLLLFFFGKPIAGAPAELSTYRNMSHFYPVFTVIFPAFTGLAAGLGLSGDLKDPKRSIPRGTIWATVIGAIVYILVALKLDLSASAHDLRTDVYIMEKIALWGPIIPIGLAAAALSSALGSVMVAPRTLQAIGVDDIIPNKPLSKWFAKGRVKDNEPVNSSVITIVIAFIFIAVAPGTIDYHGPLNQAFDPRSISSSGIDFIAEIISMFFMVTYGAICTISLLEHFAADPSYRPTFKSKWYFSLLGAILSMWAMFKMNLGYASAAMVLMVLIYYILIQYNQDRKGFEKLFRGVIFQLSRQFQVFAQRAEEDRSKSWRPFAICISVDTFKRRSAFDLLRWVSYKYGFGTYIHYIPGLLNEETNQESKKVLTKLLHLAAGSKNRVYLDTIISPSYTSAIAQVIQLSGISGKGNNMILFEFSRTDPAGIGEAMRNYHLLEATNFDVCVLNTSYKGFGYHKEIHVWITSQDYENANLMILLAYIIMGHPEWKRGLIKIFAIYPQTQIEAQKEHLLSMITAGRLPISPNNIELIAKKDVADTKEIVNKQSADADLTIIGFRSKDIDKDGVSIFNDYDSLGNVLFVRSNKEKEIK